MQEIESNKMTTSVLSLVIFLTNITQMPQLIQLGGNSLITLSCWTIAILYLLILGKESFVISKVKFRAVSYAFLMLVISVILQIWTGRNYLQTSLLYPFMLSVFVFVVGSLYSNKLHQIDTNKLFMAYSVSGFVVAIAVYYKSFASGFSWTSRGYAYGSKNSVAQIILTVFILLVFTEVGKKIPKFLRILGMIFLILLLAMLKSRASLLGIVVIVFYILLSKRIKLKYKYLTMAIVIGAFLAIYFNHNLYDIVINGIILAGRDASNLNDVSSGRLDMIGEFIHVFSKYPLWGCGSYYLESFPLSVLSQYGLLGALPIVLFVCLPCTLLKKVHRKQDKTVMIIIMICYYINGLFEEMAPLGPGVKCYFLWFLLGLETDGGNCASRR